MVINLINLLNNYYVLIIENRIRSIKFLLCESLFFSIFGDFDDVIEYKVI